MTKIKSPPAGNMFFEDILTNVFCITFANSLLYLILSYAQKIKIQFLIIN